MSWFSELDSRLRGNDGMGVAAISVVSLLAACAPTEGTAQAQTANTTSSLPADQTAWTQGCKRWDDWDKPAPPFKVHGNTYYVGTCGIAVVLVAGDDGHILIDSGTENAAELVADNIRTLGFDPADVAIMLHSHEHHDHVGGFAKLQAITNARIVASIVGARVLGTGVVAKNDPQYGEHDPMTPVATNVLVLDGELVTLGNLELTAIETPGHSPGALSWQWRSCDEQDGQQNCKSIVYADSLSPVSSDSYRFGEHAAYVAEYRQALGRVAALDCEILLTPHPSHSNMVRRLKSGDGLEDSSSCRSYADGKNRRLDNRLDEETKSANGG